jgi:hypothetical protein
LYFLDLNKLYPRKILMLKGENRNDVDPGINLIDFGRPDDRPQII